MLTVSPNDTLSTVLTPLEHDLSTVLLSLANASIEIASLCRRGLSHKTATTNAFGDTQLALDVAADEAIMKHLRKSNVVRIASSEETPIEVQLNPDGKFVVAFDPLDGSSILPCNWAVGSIMGVWQANQLVGATGDQLVACVVTVYGPRTTMFIATRTSYWPTRVIELTLTDTLWTVSKLIQPLGSKRVFAPANLRCAQDNPGYAELIALYMQERYTLRYTGGMVPDVTQLLLKGGGVFMSPVSKNAPAKLRLAYEVMPMSFLIEMAGGKSSNGEASISSLTIGSCDERSAVCLGSADEVRRFDQMCGTAARNNE